MTSLILDAEMKNSHCLTSKKPSCECFILNTYLHIY